MPHLRFKKRRGPARIGGRLGLPASTCHAVLRRANVSRLAPLDRATGRPIRRYEHQAPGDSIHVDIKKLGNISDGGGWRIHSRRIGGRNSQRHPATSRTQHRNPVIGYGYLHTAPDDHSRLTYTEILTDETREAATAFRQRAHVWFSSHGITSAVSSLTTVPATDPSSGAKPRQHRP